MILILKNRFILGYIASDDKTQNADYYLRYAHKYLLNEKYGFKLEDGVSFIRNISRKSFIPEKYIDGIVNELMKNVYDGEISKSDSILMEAYAKVFLMNEKNAVACFDDKKLHKSVMDQIVDREYSRQLNLIALKEALASTK